MKKIQSIIVQGSEVAIQTRNGSNYISLTAMTKGFEGGSALILNWLRNAKTIEYLGAWESHYNPKFNYVEYDTIRNAAVAPSFRPSVKQWIAKTCAIGLTATTGQYGGTYGHEDIAMEFGTWLSPVFKLMLIQEYKRLKADEAASTNKLWDVKRELAKVNHKVQSDAINNYLLPSTSLPENLKHVKFSNEAEMLNKIVFGYISRQWKKRNPDLAGKGFNMRDSATLEQLQLLSNLETNNASLIEEGLPTQARKERLLKIAASQRASIRAISLG